MRRLIPVFTAAALLSIASPSHAAPTLCRDVNNGVVRCGAYDAMPIGWSPPSRLDPQTSSLPEPSLYLLLSLACAVGGLFALIALMPEFDGWRAGDWDEQEGDDEKRK